nr:MULTISPECIES: CoA-disulfide reductase [Virgibacillus]
MIALTQKILIIGGVGGGATVAAQIRRDNQDAEIIIFEKGEYISFSNCGMPYYIGNKIPNREDILYATGDFQAKYQVDVRVHAEVTAIQRTTKEIEYRQDSQIHTESYDTLILSPGASAVAPSFNGMDMKRTFCLHSIPDMDAIHSFIEQEKPTSAAIIGAGFIGLEMVENLYSKGIDCTLIDQSSQVMNIVDSDMAQMIEDHLKKNNVTVVLNDALYYFSNQGQTLHLNGGTSIQADMTILAIGVKPNTKLAEDASLAIGDTGAIKVNAFMQTNDPNIYALGDVVETKDAIIDIPRNIALAGPAHRQAFIIASHIKGQQIPYKGTLGSNILKLFDLTIGSTGLNTDRLKSLNRDYETATLKTMSNASYYPGSGEIWLKVLFSKQDGKIYGAQVVGFAGVDKRLAVLATAIKGNLTVTDLPELELAYAPPYSSPKDPINVLGYKASSKLEEK